MAKRNTCIELLYTLYDSTRFILTAHHLSASLPESPCIHPTACPLPPPRPSHPTSDSASPLSPSSQRSLLSTPEQPLRRFCASPSVVEADAALSSHSVDEATVRRRFLVARRAVQVTSHARAMNGGSPSGGDCTGEWGASTGRRGVLLPGIGGWCHGERGRERARVLICDGVIRGL